MKSTAIITDLVPNRSYPLLMIADDGVIVLFTRPGTGVCVHVPTGKTRNYVGDNASNWTEGNFQPLYGSVTLEND